MKKKLLSLVVALCMIIPMSLSLVACGNDKDPETPTPEPSLYNVNFGGNVEGEKYSVAASTWEKSSEEGFEAVYTLKGEVAYDKTTADAMGYTDGRCHFVLIRFTSDTLNRVSYNEETGEGFYCKITNYYGTDHEEVKVKHGGFSSGNETTKNTTYFLYQGVDSTVRTMTLEISFDGTSANARLYKFVIDPANYTLQANPNL